MNSNFRANTLERAWFKMLRAVISSGQLIRDKEPFLEIQNLQIAYDNAFEVQAPYYKRIFGTEFLDYIHRVYSPDGDPITGRNYYRLIHEQAGVDQVIQVIKKLEADPFTRSATIILATIETPKHPCITEINFSVRHSLLHMTAMFKSSDLAKKFIPDMIELSHIHEQISRTLGVARGGVTAHLLCAQVYETDLTVVSNTIESATLSNYFKTRDIIENWDKEAAEWDKNIQKPEYYVNIENGYLRFLDFMRKDIPNADRNSDPIALDSGCGTGTIADMLKNKGYRVFGVDISPQMLHFAHKDPASIQYVLANSLDLPHGNDRFDVICSRGVLISHVGKKYVDTFLDEHCRVLKLNGLFMFDFITHFDASENKKKRGKAYMDFRHMNQRLENHGFEVVARSGTDTNRVNAVVCKKISK